MLGLNTCHLEPSTCFLRLGTWNFPLVTCYLKLFFICKASIQPAYQQLLRHGGVLRAHFAGFWVKSGVLHLVSMGLFSTGFHKTIYFADQIPGGSLGSSFDKKVDAIRIGEDFSHVCHRRMKYIIIRQMANTALVNIGLSVQYIVC